MKQILQKLTLLNVALFVAAAVVSLSPVILPHLANAQLVNTFVNSCPTDTGVRCSEGSVASIFKLIINWALAIAFIVAVIMLIWGGFRYITSAGNDEQAKAGRGTIVNALIGIVIIVLSYVIVQIVYRFVVGQSTTGVLGP